MRYKRILIVAIVLIAVLLFGCNRKVYLQYIALDADLSTTSFELEDYDYTKIYINAFYSNGNIVSVQVQNEMIDLKSVMMAGKYDAVITYKNSFLTIEITITNSDQGTEGLGYRLSPTGDYYIVSSYSGDNKDIVIPKKYLGKPVFAVAANVFEEKTINTLELPEGLKVIGSAAFKNVSGLKRIVFPKTLELIETAAFYGCDDLLSIYIPKSVAIIEEHAFNECKIIYLEHNAIPNEFQNNWYDNLYSYIYHDIASANLLYKTNTEYLVMNDTIIYANYLGTEAEVTIPSQLDNYPITTIGAHAFANNLSITKVVISDGVTVIAEGAFKQCYNIQKVLLPLSIKMIKEYAFSNCSSLSEIIFPEGLESIGDTAFNFCESLISITLPSTLETIAANAFSWCTKMKEIYIPINVTIIGSNAFYACGKLTIYAAASSPPPGWQAGWNLSNRPVEWERSSLPI